MPAKSFFAAAAFASLFTLGASSLRAEGVNTRSPFMSDSGATTAAPTENAPLELRGIVTTKSGPLFGLYDPTKKQSVWAGLNEQGSDFTVRSYDANNDIVTVDYQGRTLNLPLKAAKVESLGAIPNPALVGNMNRPGQPPSPALTASPQDEARRLEGVAAEVRRRRMMRQAAAQQNGAGPQPQQRNGVPGQGR
ncbi:MAG TPA: hypothetical protein VFT72_18825 [Opitutaceae bacterium]|nr:hypothetical protein [Opitutaceae bacterium]